MNLRTDQDKSGCRNKLEFYGKEKVPADIKQKDINVPTAPSKNIVEKFRKNCFFLT